MTLIYQTRIQSMSTAAGKLPRAGSPAPTPTDREGEHGRQPIAGIVERPSQVAGIAVDRYGLRRHTEVRFSHRQRSPRQNLKPSSSHRIRQVCHAPVDQLGD